MEHWTAATLNIFENYKFYGILCLTLFAGKSRLLVAK